MRTAVYARFSSDLQKKTSLEDQVLMCREAANERGWIWQDAHVYTDAAMSGASREGRTGLDALMKAAETRPRPFDVVLVDDTSRVGRDLPDAVRVLQTLKFFGVRVLYISQGIDSANEQAEMIVAMHGITDSIYIREMAHKIIRGLAGQIERGFHTGSALFGYRSLDVPDPSGRTDSSGRPELLGRRRVINEPEADIIRWIYTSYAEGIGVNTIVARLNARGMQGPRGATWKFGAVRRLLQNERFTGKQIWGQSRTERRPGTRQKVARPRPRSEWRIVENDDLRIVSDGLFAAVQARLKIAGAAQRQAGTSLMRGGNAAMHSRHLFSGFMRCGACGGAITVVTGGWGMPRYGCQRRSKNGATACSNGLTIRAKIADAALLEGLQAELLRPATQDYITDRLAAALNELRNRRPAQREELDRAIAAAEQKLRHLVAAVEAGAGAPTLFQAIKDREEDIRAFKRQRSDMEEPLDQRLAVIPTWVRQQLVDAASLLRAAPERAKAEFQRLGLSFTIHEVREEGSRPFLRAEGTGQFEHLAFSAFTQFTTADRSLLRSRP